MALLFKSQSASASIVDVRCPDLPVTETGELQARARLLLSSAGFDSAKVGVECDASGAWLIWTDGSRTTIDVHSGVVEGALDAIESRVSAARSERAAAAKNGAAPQPELVPPGLERTDSKGIGDGSREGSAGERDSDDGQAASEKKKPVVVSGPRAPLEGGVSVATTTEFWSANIGVGLRVEVGVGIGEHLAVVVGQAVRLGVPAPEAGEITVYDLQAGFAIGAPFRSREGFGLVLLGGAERLSNSGFNSSGAWLWAAAASLGARASVQVGAVDLWFGADVAARSRSLDVRGDESEGVPSVSGSLSLGCFFPAFSRETTARSAPTRSVGMVR